LTQVGQSRSHAESI